MKLKLRDRLLLTYVLLAILGVGGLSLRFGLLEKARIIDASEHELEINAFTVAAAVGAPLENFIEEGEAYITFAQRLDRISRPLDARLTVLTLQGNPIYDSEVDFRKLGNQLNQTEVSFALQGLEQHEIRPDPITGENRLYAAAPVQSENKVYGVVQLSVPIAPIDAEIAQGWLILGGTATVIILLTVAASLWLAQYILKPITQLQSAARSFAAGDLDRQIPVKGNDELAELAHTFNEMAAQLKEMIRKQRLFVANASHELRTPLTNIKLRAEALLDGAMDDPDVSGKFLNDIDHETARMESLTASLLTLSKVDSPVELEATRVKLSPLLQDVCDTFSPLATQKHIELVMDCDINSEIHGNPEQLHRVFDNLVSNAIKYSPPHSRVRLSVEETRTEVIVTVADTGQGIPAEDLPRIFDRFYRVDKARTRTATDPGGSGLGLSIVQSIVRAHGGQINVTSQPGRGTTFVIRLPKSQGN